MLTKEEKVKWILRNCIDEYGNIDLSDLNFSNFNGNIDISGMIAKKNINQDSQKAGGSIYQHCQVADGDLYQHNQEVKGELLNHRLEDDEEWFVPRTFGYVEYVIRKRKLKDITRRELIERGYKLKGE